MGLRGMSFEDLRAAYLAELADRPGVCSCPVLPDGARGFRQRCEVHGGRSREDFARITGLRAEMFTRMRQPASVKGHK